jgi:hypothetical protein
MVESPFRNDHSTLRGPIVDESTTSLYTHPMTGPQRTPEEIDWAKRLMLDIIGSGRTLVDTLALMRIGPVTVNGWRRYDPAFDAALNAALAQRVATFGAKRAHLLGLRHGPDVPYLKERLLHHIVNDHLSTSDALDEIGAGRDALATWRREDPQFAEEFNNAVEALTEHEADRLKRLHEEVDDPKMCAVASKNLQWWLAARNARFRQRAPAEDSNLELTGILRSAVQRLIEMSHAPGEAPQALPVVDAEAEPVPVARRIDVEGT